MVGFFADRFRILASASDAQLANAKLALNDHALRRQEVNADVLLLRGVVEQEAGGDNARHLRAETYVDQATGLSFVHRQWGSADFDEHREIIECSYGYLTGNTAALLRITS